VILNLFSACSARSGVHQFGIVAAAFIMLISILCFIWSQQSLPSSLTGQIYYEYAFWGGGHILQFAHTQLLLVCWLWLSRVAGLRVPLGKKAILAIYCIGVLSSLGGIFIYFISTPTSDEHRNAFTALMKHANGIAPLILGGFIFYALVTKKESNSPDTILPKIMLVMSMLLFTVGGSLGYLIAGSNLIVPAHYHGSIIGITLAFMGICYQLLPRFGYASVTFSKLAKWQPVVYGGGMLCWMLGMALLGMYGVSRKTPGSADTMGNMVAGLKHGSDGLALIGGLLFVFVVLKAVWKSDNSEKI
jgi:hypothetical protein